MKTFSSYGPVSTKSNYYVPRTGIVDKCTAHLIGSGEGGNFFTIWAPRQTGKTWIMEQAIAKIHQNYTDEFVIGRMSMQGVHMEEENSAEEFLWRIPSLLRYAFGLEHVDVPESWEDFRDLFSTGDEGVFDRPVILMIDEFDNLPQVVIDSIVSMFRELYLDRSKYYLHGLALIGVQAVMGVGSERGSPFNVQRGVNIPNLTHLEVIDMFGQYRTESGQVVKEAVVDEIYRVTRGQPGLVSWFGELLTEKYNPGNEHTLGSDTWSRVYRKALQVEPSNTIMNLLAKVRSNQRDRVLKLYANPNTPFDFSADWCNTLYLNGVIIPEESENQSGTVMEVCRFSNHFIQERIYNTLTADMYDHSLPILPLDPLDTLDDFYIKNSLNVPKLIDRYKAYLIRLEASKINPWQDQPRRRTDLQLQESVGHFHLYAWLQGAIGRECVISPEFPTGNGKVDLHLTWNGDPNRPQGLIEVKSFVDLRTLNKGREQAAQYARQSGLDSVTVVVFAPIKDEYALEQLSSEEKIDEILVTVVAIGWM